MVEKIYEFYKHDKQLVWYDQYHRDIYLFDGSDMPIIRGKGFP